MEGLTRLVSESMARHGFDRPLDYRRLKWSRWFRCESHHSLLFVPSSPGVFALAEEITSARLASAPGASIGEDAFVRSASEGSVNVSRMLAVTQFFEADDMAFVLDRMLSRPNPMRARLQSGSYFVRYVVIDDEHQRRSIASALNQWILSSSEKATGIGAHFASSLELTPQSDQNNLTRTPGTAATPAEDLPTTRSMPAHGLSNGQSAEVSNTNTNLAVLNPTAPQLDSGAAANRHCPSPLPSGF